MEYECKKTIMIRCSIRETFTSFKDLEIIATCVNVNIPSLTACAYARVGMFTLTHIAIISGSSKLNNLDAPLGFITETLILKLNHCFFYFKKSKGNLQCFLVH